MATFTLTDGQAHLILDGVCKSTKANQDLQQAVHESNLMQSKITRAISATDKCDGSTPHVTREWLSTVDGYVEDFLNTEESLDEFLRSTTHGLLLTSLRSWLKISKKWSELRIQIVSTYLSACEDLLLQRQLEDFQQGENEPIPLFTCRFHAAANMAYPSPRSAEDEQKTKIAFFRSLNLPKVALKLYQESDGKTLEQVLDSAIIKSAQYDRFMFMRLRPGEQLIDTSTAAPSHQPFKSTKGKPNVDLDSKFSSLSGRLDRLATKVKKIKLTTSQRPVAKVIDRRPRQEQKLHAKLNQAKFINSLICYLCGIKGHIKRNCYARFTNNGQPICSVCKTYGHYTAACTRPAPGYNKAINHRGNHRTTLSRQTRAVNISHKNKPKKANHLN